MGLLAPAIAMADPGHDGHEMTWDLGHLAEHPLATIGCFLVVAAASWATWRFVFRRQSFLVPRCFQWVEGSSKCPAVK